MPSSGRTNNSSAVCTGLSATGMYQVRGTLLVDTNDARVVCVRHSPDSSRLRQSPGVYVAVSCRVSRVFPTPFSPLTMLHTISFTTSALAINRSTATRISGLVPMQMW